MNLEELVRRIIHSVNRTESRNGGGNSYRPDHFYRPVYFYIFFSCEIGQFQSTLAVCGKDKTMRPHVNMSTCQH